ncbi:hypothetical protein F443_15101 [Phytophthora nicotianae P1569]|nr:hypothetical protein F443_15101 [Phytophthora nicotianae P1569]
MACTNTLESDPALSWRRRIGFNMVSRAGFGVTVWTWSLRREPSRRSRWSALELYYNSVSLTPCHSRLSPCPPTQLQNRSSTGVLVTKASDECGDMAEVASSKKYAALLQPNACASDEIRSRFLDSLSECAICIWFSTVSNCNACVLVRLRFCQDLGGNHSVITRRSWSLST